jgi:hypothetical protein
MEGLSHPLPHTNTFNWGHVYLVDAMEIIWFVASVKNLFVPTVLLNVIAVEITSVQPALPQSKKIFGSDSSLPSYELQFDRAFCLQCSRKD